MYILASHLLSAFPEWVTSVSRALPLTYIIEGERMALSGNSGGMLLPLLILGGFTLFSLLLAVLTFRRDPYMSQWQRLRLVRVS